MCAIQRVRDVWCESSTSSADMLQYGQTKAALLNSAVVYVCPMFLRQRQAVETGQRRCAPPAGESGLSSEAGEGSGCLCRYRTMCRSIKSQRRLQSSPPALLALCLFVGACIHLSFCSYLACADALQDGPPP